MIVGTNKVWRGVSNNNTVTLNSVIKIGSDVCKPIAPEYYPGNITSWQYIRLWTIPSSIKCGGVAPCYMQ